MKRLLTLMAVVITMVMNMVPTAVFADATITSVTTADGTEITEGAELSEYVTGININYSEAPATIPEVTLQKVKMGNVYECTGNMEIDTDSTARQFEMYARDKTNGTSNTSDDVVFEFRVKDEIANTANCNLSFFNHDGTASKEIARVAFYTTENKIWINKGTNYKGYGVAFDPTKWQDIKFVFHTDSNNKTTFEAYVNGELATDENVALLNERTGVDYASFWGRGVKPKFSVADAKCYSVENGVTTEHFDFADCATLNDFKNHNYWKDVYSAGVLATFYTNQVLESENKTFNSNLEENVYTMDFDGYLLESPAKYLLKADDYELVFDTTYEGEQAPELTGATINNSAALNDGDEVMANINSIELNYDANMSEDSFADNLTFQKGEISDAYYSTGTQRVRSTTIKAMTSPATSNTDDTVTFEFKVKVNAPLIALDFNFMGLNSSGASKIASVVKFNGVDQKICASHGTTYPQSTNSKAQPLDNEKWYDLKVEFTKASGIYNYTAYINGTAITTANVGTINQVTGITYAQVYCPATTNPEIYIASARVSSTSGEKFKADFENCETIEDLQESGYWDDSQTNDKTATSTIVRNQVIETLENVAFTGDLSGDLKTYTITFDQPLAKNQKYLLRTTTGIKGQYGTNVAKAEKIAFNTIPLVSKINSITNADGTVKLTNNGYFPLIQKQIDVNFSGDMQEASLSNISLRKVELGNVYVTRGDLTSDDTSRVMSTSIYSGETNGTTNSSDEVVYEFKLRSDMNTNTSYLQFYGNNASNEKKVISVINFDAVNFKISGSRAKLYPAGINDSKAVNFSRDSWYDVKVIFTKADGEYTYAAYIDDNEIIQPGTGLMNAVNGIDYMTYYAPAAVKPAFYFDYVKVSDKEGTIFETDFSNYNTVDELKAAGYWKESSLGTGANSAIVKNCEMSSQPVTFTGTLSNNKNYTIEYTTPIEYLATYVLEIGDNVLNMEGAPITNPQKLTFYAVYSDKLYSKDAMITDGTKKLTSLTGYTGNIIASANVFNYSTGETPVTAKLICAVYEDDALCDVKFADVSLTGGQSNTITTPAINIQNAGNYTVSTMLWDGLTTLFPIMPSVDVPENN